MGAAHPERLSRIASLDDGGYGSFQILQHIARRQPYHRETLRRQIGIAPHIAPRPVPALMRLAVNLNRQPSFEADKIEHKLTQWMLPPKFITTRSLAQFAPD
jgi:hypothetical protein